jgi:hypothetical protein
MPRGRPRKMPNADVSEAMIMDLKNDVEHVKDLLDKPQYTNPKWWFELHNRLGRLVDWYDEDE